jgi:hypothetical protein
LLDKIENLLNSKTILIPTIITFTILLAASSIINVALAAGQLSGQTRIAASADNMSNNSSISVGVYTNPRLAFSDNTNHTFVIWSEIKSTTLISRNQNVQGPVAVNHTSNLYYRVSGDNGKTFGKTISPGNFSVGEVTGPAVASEENGTNAYAVWAANTTDNDYHLYFTRTSADGSSFEHPVLITKDYFPISSHTGNRSSVLSGIIEPQIIASSGNRVFLLWSDETSKITYSNKALPSNRSIFPPSFSGTIISNGSLQTPQSSLNQQLQYAPPSYETSIQTYFVSSNDGGKTFSTKMSILNQTSSSNGTAAQVAIPPRLAASGSNVYIVSILSGGDDIHHPQIILTKSQDTGKTFEKSQIAIPGYDNTNEAVRWAVPYAAAGASGNDSKSLYIAAMISENVSKGVSTTNNIPTFPLLPAIYSQMRFHYIIMHSADGGVTFGNPIEISNATIGQGFPVIDVSSDGSRAYVARIDAGNVSSGLQGYPFFPPFPFTRGTTSNDNSTAGSILVGTITNNVTSVQNQIRLKDSKGSALSLSFDFGGSTFQLLHSGNQGLFVVKETLDYNSSNGSGFAIPEPKTLVWSSTDGGRTFKGPTSIVQPLNSHLVTAAVSYAQGNLEPSLFMVWEGDGGSIYLQKLATP